jgi:hypothetical protein
MLAVGWKLKWGRKKKAGIVLYPRHEQLKDGMLQRRQLMGKRVRLSWNIIYWMITGLLMWQIVAELVAA